MKREDLKKLGIEDSLVDSIMALHGSDIEKHKTDLATAQTELGSLKTQLTEAGATIEGFKKLDMVPCMKVNGGDFILKGYSGGIIIQNTSPVENYEDNLKLMWNPETFFIRKVR